MRENKNTNRNSGTKKTRQKKTQAPKNAKIQTQTARKGNGKHTNPPRRKQTDNPRTALSNPRRNVHSKAYQILIALLFLSLGTALFLLLSTFTQSDLSADTEVFNNLFGKVGAHAADIMFTLFGLAAFYFSLICLIIGVYTFVGKKYEVKASEIVGLCLLIVGSVPLFDKISTPIFEHAPGGIFGTWLATLADTYLPASLTVCICLFFILFGVLLVTDKSFKSFIRGCYKLIKWLCVTLGNAFAQPFKKHPEDQLPASDEPSVDTPAPSQTDAFDNDYEDSPSQLLNDVASDLAEREARAQHPVETEPSPTNDVPGECNALEEDNALPSDDDVLLEPSDVWPDNAIDATDDAPDERDDAHDDDQELTPSEDHVEATDNALMPTEAIRETEAAAPEAKKENIGDLVARICKNTPKSRTIRSKRSHSVPALEPDFEFDSILSPEQISVGAHRITSAASGTTADAPYTHEVRTGVLSNWKPRSIRKSFAETPQNNAQRGNDSAPHDDNLNDNMPLSPNIKPQHMTRDLLAQLTTGYDDAPFLSDQTKIAQTGNETLVPAKADNQTRSAYPDKIFDEMAPLLYPTGLGPKMTPKNDLAPQDKKTIAAQNQSIVVPKINETRVPIQQQKTSLPLISEELRMLLSETTGEDAFEKNDIQPQTAPAPRLAQNAAKNDVKKTCAALASERPTPGAENSDDQDSFIVAEEKKKPSERELEAAEKARMLNKSMPDYQLPPLSLLHYNAASQKGFDREALREFANKIKEKLEEYKVFGDIVNICPGPVVTRFEYLPAPGTKVAKIEGLWKDLMMALEICSIRILAPIPGKNVVGIEIPNENRNTIYFKEVVASEPFQNAKSLLTIALGKDSEGEPVVSDLAKMPHLLVAGTTGSGKSVGINTMLCSLLYNASPDEVKLILVDPKMLELSIYAGIPHLLVPPITTPAETASALEWACDEMDERYRKLASFGVRNIAGYNEQLKNPTLPSAIECVKELDDDGEPKYKPMPYIVIVVDEFADLMMVAGKEIEKSIARLAQKARAAGIHIILATQRPSTNVVTGVIKANFPTRLAFKVMTLTDSRVILDQRGAETLLGNGDSLFLAPNGSLSRVHGAYVSDEEVQSIVAFLSGQRPPEYNLDIITPKDDDASEAGACAADNSEKLDELFDQAVEIVRDAGQASASLLQRRLGIGFNRGARLIEQMERHGIVGPQRGQKPREVLY